MDLNAKPIIERLQIAVDVSKEMSKDDDILKGKWIPLSLIEKIIEDYNVDLEIMEEQHDKDCNPNNMENKNGTKNL